MALILKITFAEYEPVEYPGLFVKLKFTLTVAGSAELQDPPPPVQVEAGRVTTEVCAEVDAVMVPLHAVPKPAPPHV